MIDLLPAAHRTIDVLTSVTDDQLALATPCPGSSVGDLIDHVGMFAVRFAAAARKDVDGPASPPPAPDAAHLEPAWRARLSRDLLSLADAWGRPEAWDGTTSAGAIVMPAAVVGLVALDELVVHGWDLAVATAQPYAPTSEEIAGAVSFVTSFDAPRNGSLFGPIVAVPDGATELERLLGLTGRDPSWRPTV